PMISKGCTRDRDTTRMDRSDFCAAQDLHTKRCRRKRLDGRRPHRVVDVLTTDTAKSAAATRPSLYRGKDMHRPPFSLPGHRVVPREPRFSLCDSFDVEKSCDGAASQGRYEPSTRRAPAPPQGHIGVEHGHFLASVVHVHALWPGADT